MNRDAIIRAASALPALLLAAGAARAAGTGDVAAAASEGPVYPVEQMMEAPPLPPQESVILSRVFDRFPGENREQVLAYIREQFPDDLRRFKALALRDLNEAGDYLSGLVREALDLIEMKKRDPAAYAQRMDQRRLEQEAREAGEAVRRSEGAEREKQVARLEALLGQAFSTKQELMRAEVRQMEKDLAELTRLLEEREKNRAEIIRRRAGELTGKADHLQW